MLPSLNNDRFIFKDYDDSYFGREREQRAAAASSLNSSLESELAQCLFSLLYGGNAMSADGASPAQSDEDRLAALGQRIHKNIVTVLRSAPAVVWGETEEDLAASSAHSNDLITELGSISVPLHSLKAEASAFAEDTAKEVAPVQSGSDGKRRKLDVAAAAAASSSAVANKLELSTLTDEQIDKEKARACAREISLGREGRAATGLVPSLDLLRRMSLPVVTLTDYVLALTRLPMNLYPYVFQRATENDYNSLVLCRNLCVTVKYALSQFNFRNGPLRRAFDALNHSERQYADFLLEHALTNPGVDPSQADAAALKEHEAELGRVLDWVLSPLVQFYGRCDEKRELLIKGCRDVQKNAKTAIYDVHRGNFDRAKDKLRSCETTVVSLLHLIFAPDPATDVAGNSNDRASAALAAALQDQQNVRNAQRDLRSSGSFTSCLEEWAEAALLLHFQESGGEILAIDQMSLPLTIAEYVGALSDLSGEIARVAVAAATARDSAAVSRAFSALLSLAVSLQALSLPRSLTGKRDACLKNKSKIEKIIYEQSLSVRMGRKIASSIEDNTATADEPN